MERPIVYVTREIERALGKAPASDYLIVSNRTSYGESTKKLYPDFVLLIDPAVGAIPGTLLGTTDLLNHEETKKFIAGITPAPRVLVFKNTSRVETAAHAHGWELLNPKASLSEEVENKMTQVAWLGELGEKYLPEHIIRVCKDLRYDGKPRIIQWAHGHTGGGTMLVNSEKELEALQQKFPERMARSTEYIQGPSFTLSAVVAADKVLVGNPSYQITGMPPFTDNKLTTIGNDWSISLDLLSHAEVEAVQAMAGDIGKKLNISGWRGLFGIDLIHDTTRGRLFLIEINARQPASVPLESFFQAENRTRGLAGLTIFEAHLRALLGQPIDQLLIPINDGAQIVQRVTGTVKKASVAAATALAKKGYTTVSYENSIPNADLLRVQSEKGIMERHDVFNKRGKEILDALAS